MFLLDTNVISELRVPKRANLNVLAWASAQPVGAQFISAITVLELELGVRQKERGDKAQGGILRAWLEGQVLPQFAGRVLAFDQVVAIRCASLHVPDPRAERDAIIAATALAHGMTVVSRNTDDFKATGVPLLNPWH
ncbi:type II toxin-antitoxin system VapC family toxin [Pandoraea oxalativorans]|uniref:Twitching motility protein PilT n=1 Tax=Pandoraea oxalativorans TaxID=573737 RepID=A0A0G3IIG7_9BURK|nr:type II toxin-antitoxin system VapC family toxin [Pandoraea oxalativorans]AKK24900.1 twitching motility protein PilT [Pandoraea oxalativorans]